MVREAFSTLRGVPVTIFIAHKADLEKPLTVDQVMKKWVYVEKGMFGLLISFALLMKGMAVAKSHFDAIRAGKSGAGAKKIPKLFQCVSPACYVLCSDGVTAPCGVAAC